MFVCLFTDIFYKIFVFWNLEYRHKLRLFCIFTKPFALEFS